MCHPKKYKNCPICGKFTKKNGRCIDAVYDDYNGGWDHW